MSICGRSEWCGPDPKVVRLTDNGVRKVQIELEDAWGKQHRFVLAATVKNVNAFIIDLEMARAWVREG